MEENEKGPVHIMHKCVDTEKRERSLVSAGQRKEQRIVVHGKKTSIHIYSLDKYVLSTNQVLDKATKMESQPLPTRRIVRRETRSVGMRRKKSHSAW